VYQTDTIRVIACGASCSAETQRHTAVFLSDILTLDEYPSVFGYARKDLGSKTLALSSTNFGQAVFSSAAITYTALAPSGTGLIVSKLVFVKWVTAAADSPALGVLDLTQPPAQTFAGTNNDVTITPPAGGWFRDAHLA
jgi:hypothetical protein